MHTQNPGRSRRRDFPGPCTFAANDFALVTYNGDGSLDTGFGTGGMLLTDLGGRNNVANAVALAANGGIVATGSSDADGSADFASVRYTGR